MHEGILVDGVLLTMRAPSLDEKETTRECPLILKLDFGKGVSLFSLSIGRLVLLSAKRHMSCNGKHITGKYRLRVIGTSDGFPPPSVESIAQRMGGVRDGISREQVRLCVENGTVPTLILIFQAFATALALLREKEMTGKLALNVFAFCPLYRHFLL